MPRVIYDEMWDPFRYLAEADKRWRCTICGYDAVKLTPTGGPRALNDHNLETGDCSYRKMYGEPGENVPPTALPEPTPVINHGNGVRTQYHSTGGYHRGTDYRDWVLFIPDEAINWKGPTVAELERVMTAGHRLTEVSSWELAK